MEKVINKAIEGYKYSLGAGKLVPIAVTNREEQAVKVAVTWGLAEFLYQICNGFQSWVQEPAKTNYQITTYKGGKEYERRTRR